MEAANLKQSLEDAFTTLEALKNRLESSTASNSAPKVDPLPEGLQSAIARLSVELGKVAGMGDNARQEPLWDDEEYKSEASKATELISGMSPKPFVGRKTVTFDQVLAHTDGLQSLKAVPSELPETPFRPPAMPSEAPLSALPHSTPGLPANTPMAVQVLAGLLGLSTNALASQPKFDTANQNDDPVLKLVKPSAAPTGKRAAAVRAAAAAAGIIARPRPQAVESGKRKTCNCKRSQCLKLYCDCFAAGGYCLPGCSCYNCSNREADAKTVEAQRNIILAKDPMAFDRKIEGESHKKGCRCKRSKCLKKYCECYNGGIRCNPEICQCEDCQNGTDATELEAYEERKQEEDMELENPVLAPMASRDIKNENTQPNVQTMSTKASKSEAAASQQQMMDGIVASQGAGDPSVVAWNAAADTAKAAAAAAAALFAPMAFPGSTTGMDADAIQLMHLVFAPAFTAAAAEIHATSIPAKPSQLNKDATVMASAQLVTDVLTPGSAMRVGPPALTSHLSDVNFTGGRGEEQDTATSPPLHNGGHPPVVATMTGGAHVARRADSFGCATGSDDESMIRKRPRRAASGGVQGAVAAAVSDWGLDIVSPPHKRSASLPGDMGRAPGLGGRRVGNALLRKALQNDAAVAATAQHKNDGDVADAVSALVSLNSQGQ